MVDPFGVQGHAESPLPVTVIRSLVRHWTLGSCRGAPPVLESLRHIFLEALVSRNVVPLPSEPGRRMLLLNVVPFIIVSVLVALAIVHLTHEIGDRVSQV